VLVPIAVEGIAHRHFFTLFLPLALLAIIFAVPLGIQTLVPWPALAAAVLLAVGFHLIFRRRGSSAPWAVHHRGSAKGNGGEVNYAADNVVSRNISFGASTEYLHSTDLQKVSLRCHFGALQVYFDNAQLNPAGAEVNVDCSFGGIELYVPRSWPVKISVDTMLGGVDEKDHPSGQRSGPELRVTGSVSLGGVEIIYI